MDKHLTCLLQRLVPYVNQEVADDVAEAGTERAKMKDMSSTFQQNLPSRYLVSQWQPLKDVQLLPCFNIISRIANTFSQSMS